jgi:hypothetical protein
MRKYKELNVRWNIEPNEMLIKTCIARYCIDYTANHPGLSSIPQPSIKWLYTIIRSKLEDGGLDALHSVDRYWGDDVLQYRDAPENQHILSQVMAHVDRYMLKPY